MTNMPRSGKGCARPRVTRDLAGSGSRGALPGAHRLAVGEAMGLRWSEVDLARRTARLADTKTGLSIRPLSHAACDVLSKMPRMPGELVFPATRGLGRLLHFKKFWPRIAKLGGLPKEITP